MPDDIAGLYPGVTWTSTTTQPPGAHNFHGVAQDAHQFRRLGDRAKAGKALCAGQPCQIRRGIIDALPDPPILDRPVAIPRDAFLVQFVVEEGSIVGDDYQ